MTIIRVLKVNFRRTSMKKEGGRVDSQEKVYYNMSRI